MVPTLVVKFGDVPKSIFEGLIYEFSIFGSGGDRMALGKLERLRLAALMDIRDCCVVLEGLASPSVSDSPSCPYALMYE